MKNDRLFAITYTLMHKKSVTAPELASQLGVSVRTIYRDIDTLSLGGVPIYCTQGKGGGISILEQYSMDKAMLSDEEQNQVLLALQSAEVTGQLDVADSITKLSALFQKDIEHWIEIDFTGWSQNDKDREQFATIKTCIQKSTPLSFTYFNNEGIESKRIVEPYKLIFKGTQWYLYAYCRERKDYRFFKLTRMENLTSLTEFFQKTSKLSIPSNYNYLHKEPFSLVTLKIHKSMAFRVYDEFEKSTVHLEDDYFLIDTYLPINEWLIHYLLGFGKTLEIIEPIHLKDLFQKELELLLKKYL